MKKCLVCGATYPPSTSRCSACGAEPNKQEGFTAYAPALAQGGGGFKATYFGDLARLEAGYFWFRARNRLIIWALGKYCQEFRSFLEIGCGTGYVLSGIDSAFPGAQIHGSEIFTAGLVFAAASPKISAINKSGYLPMVREKYFYRDRGFVFVGEYGNESRYALSLPDQELNVKKLYFKSVVSDISEGVVKVA